MREKVEFKLVADHKTATQHERDLKIVLNGPLPNHKPGESITVTYNLSIEYFGDVARRLEAIERLANNGVIIGGTVEEVNHGRILIHEVLRRLERIGVLVQ